MLPGALKYGDLPALAALAAPGELYVHHLSPNGAPEYLLKTVYEAAGAGEKLTEHADKQPAEKVLAWLLR
jgi:hypothetical protein